MSKSDLKFKIGDRVEVCGHWDAFDIKDEKYQGLLGTVVTIDDCPPLYGVKFDKKIPGIFHELCEAKVPDGYGYWMHGRNMKLAKAETPVAPTTPKTDNPKIGDRIVCITPYLKEFGEGTIVEIKDSARNYLAQFEILHDGNGLSSKKYENETCYWLQASEFKVIAAKDVPKLIVIPTKIGEFNVIPKAHSFHGKFYLEIDKTKPMVFTETKCVFNSQANPIDIIAVLPDSCDRRFISASGSLNHDAYIICPREYAPAKKMTRAEIEEKLGFKIEVV